MSVLELNNQGVIIYLFKNGLVSSSMVSYINYYERFLVYRNMGKTYRESIRLLSEENNVSETTIKKAVRLMEGTTKN
jgi:hypothetical protein